MGMSDGARQDCHDNKKPASGRLQEGFQPKVWTQDKREMEAMAEAIGAKIQQSIHMNGLTPGRDDLHNIIVSTMEQEASMTRSQGGSEGSLTAQPNWKPFQERHVASTACSTSAPNSESQSGGDFFFFDGAGEQDSALSKAGR
jgi:hypothetical protein